MRQTNADRTATTDDRGIFRVWNLLPGKYYVEVAGRSGGANLYAGDSPPQYNADQAFLPGYFGGGRSLESAAPVEIEAGTEATADAALKLEPSNKIRGSLANFVPRRTVKFELFAADEDVSASRVSVNGSTGRFEIQDVVAGAYTLRATQGESVAEVGVSVNGNDVDGILAQLMPGVDIKIVTRFAGVQGHNPPAAYAKRFPRQNWIS
jgi:hypothetical protein